MIYYLVGSIILNVILLGGIGYLGYRTYKLTEFHAEWSISDDALDGSAKKKKE